MAEKTNEFRSLEPNRQNANAANKSAIKSLLYLKDSSEKQENGASDALKRASARILIVDDEPVLAELVSRMLGAHGHSVSNISHNGKEGLEYYSKHWQDIDIVILDMIMPVMGGADCFEGMKKVNPKVKVIIASGYASEEDTNRVNQLGAKAFLTKPFNFDMFFKTVSSVLNE